MAGKIVVGDDRTLTVTMIGEDGNPLNLSDTGDDPLDAQSGEWHVRFTKPKGETTDHFTRAATFPDKAAGKVRLQFLTADFTNPSIKTGTIAVWCVLTLTGPLTLTMDKPVKIPVVEHPYN